MKTILIIGGSGFIGSNLIEYFCERGHKVVNFSRSECNIEHSNLTNVYGNCTNMALMDTVFADHKIDLVIHSLMSFSTMSDLQSCQEHTSTNLAALIDLTNVMKKYGTNELVFISSGGAVYGISDTPILESHETAPVSFYGWMKEVSEKYLEFFIRTNPDFKYIILRPANVYGRYQKLDRLIGVSLKNACLDLPITIFGDVNTKKDYLHIDDLCDIVYRAISKDKWYEIYNLGSGVGTSIQEILECVKRVTSKSITVDIQEMKTGDVPYNILNIDKIISELQKRDFVSVEEGIRSMYEYVIRKLAQQKALTSKDLKMKRVDQTDV